MFDFDSMSAIENFFASQESDAICVGDPNALEKFYKRIREDYSVEEMQDILDCDENMLIVSCAGSGKTTTLILKLIRDFLKGKFTHTKIVNGIEMPYTSQILVTTFLKTGATELKKSMNEMIKKYNIKGIDMNAISFRTMHAEVYQSLLYMNYQPNIVDESDTYKYIRKACKNYNIHSQMAGKNKELTNDEVKDIACILTYARNRLDNSKYDHPLMSEYNIGEIELKAILEDFKMYKKLERVEDFEDLEEMLYDACGKYPNVLNYISGKYEYVYLDEFQDTSQLQYAILQPYLKNAKGFIAVGDDDQCIYSWRGSDVDLIQNRIAADYNPTIRKLTINRRCSENILKPIIPSIEKNTGRHKKNLRASKKGGKVEIVVDGGASYLMKSIREDLMRSEKVGILGRTNNDLLIPALLLELDGYSSFSLSNSVSLKDRAPAFVLGVMDLLCQRYNENFEGYFKMFVGKYNSFEATKLADMLSRNTDYNLYNIDLRDLEYSAPSLFSIIRMLRQTCKYNPETHKFEGDRVKAYLNLLDIIEQDVYSSKSIYAQRARDFTFYMRKIIKEHERVKDLTFDELYQLFTKDIAESLEKKKAQANRRVKKADGSWGYEAMIEDKSFVRITTVHDAKGKQWDNVYIWNDVDGCFPNSVGGRTLTKEEYEEERRVHYIAWTRAVKKLTVFTRSDRLDGFLTECDLSDATIIDVGETKRLTRKTMDKTADELVKGEPKEVKPEVKKDWVWYVKEYCKKYTSYSYICTPKGSNLDLCLIHFDGVDNLVKKLEEYHLESYPVSDLELVISDILEQLANMN